MGDDILIPDLYYYMMYDNRKQLGLLEEGFQSYASFKKGELI